MGFIGWVGALALGLCAIPMAWGVHKAGNASSFSALSLGLWLTGEIATIIYILPLGKEPLLVNYLANTICTLVIIKYKIKPRGE